MLTGKYKKENGLLKPISLSQLKQYEHYVSTLPEGSLVEFYYELQSDDGTLPQLAKVHAMIREIATHIGESFENTKLLVKDKAGLCISKQVSGKEYLLAKSFGECSKEELSLAIQAAIEIGEQVNLILH